MMRKLLSRRVWKWVGTLVCVLILCAVTVSARWTLQWSHDFTNDSVALNAGAIVAEWGVLDWIRWYKPSLQWPPRHMRDGFSAFMPAESEVWVRRLSPRYVPKSSGIVGELVVPLWIPFVVIGIPTAILWRLDRRRPLPGHCTKCNYNLTGNTSGRCPECGTAIAT